MLITKEMEYVNEWMTKKNVSGDPFNLMHASIGHLLTEFLYDASREFNQPTVIRCSCKEDDKTGTVKVDCCNICGLPDEEWWGKNCL